MELSCTAPTSHCLGCAGGRCWAGITRCRGGMVAGRDTEEPADPGCQGTGTELGSPRCQQTSGRRDAEKPERAGVTCLLWAEGRGSPVRVPGMGQQNEQGGARDGAPLPAFGDAVSGRRFRFLSGAGTLTKPPTRRGSAPRRPRRPGPPPAAADKEGTALIYPPPSRDRREGGGLRRCGEAPAGRQGLAGHSLHPATKSRSRR